MAASYFLIRDSFPDGLWADFEMPAQSAGQLRKFGRKDLPFPVPKEFAVGPRASGEPGILAYVLSAPVRR